MKIIAIDASDGRTVAYYVFTKSWLIKKKIEEIITTSNRDDVYMCTNEITKDYIHFRTHRKGDDKKDDIEKTIEYIKKRLKEIKIKEFRIEADEEADDMIEADEEADD